LGLVPLLGINLLRYSQHWQAADVFRCAPLAGPARLCQGTRRAVLLLLTLPLAILFVVLTWLLSASSSDLLLLLPGVIALPIYGMAASLVGKAVPLSMPSEGLKSTSRGALFLVQIMIGFVLAGVVAFAWSGGWF